MKSILFEKGKLYVVELPDLSVLRPANKLQALTAAFANKVEVKNPELLPFIFAGTTCFKSDNVDFGKQLTDGETFPLPADLTFDKETGMLKRIEPEKDFYCDEKYKVGYTCEEKCPACEKTDNFVEPEETQASIYDKFIYEYTRRSNGDDLYESIRSYMLKRFTIQRKKS